jgi:ATPase inhibitor, mitochondrial
LRNKVAEQNKDSNTGGATQSSDKARDFEGGFGGQEDLEDRYATTSGEH